MVAGLVFSVSVVYVAAIVVDDGANEEDDDNDQAVCLMS